MDLKLEMCSLDYYVQSDSSLSADEQQLNRYFIKDI